MVGMEEPSDDTPSVTPVGRDSSLREGAGMRAVPFNVPPRNRNVAGDFHRPYEAQKFLYFTIYYTQKHIFPKRKEKFL